jgi:hypothetical protein
MHKREKLKASCIRERGLIGTQMHTDVPPALSDDGSLPVELCTLQSATPVSAYKFKNCMLNKSSRSIQLQRT